MTEIKKYEKKDGTKAYMFKIYIGRNEQTGKKITTTRRGFKTKKEARLAMSKLTLDINKTGFQQYSHEPFEKIYDEWFKHYKTTVKESTYTKTEEHFTLHIIPEIGNIPIDKLRTIDVQQAVTKWFDEKLTRYKRFLNYVYRVLDWAYKMQIVDDNVATRVIAPVNTDQVKSMKNNFYDLDQLKHFFECLYDYDNPQALIFFRVLAFSGMRKGEALALKWSDVDLKNMQISITKTQSQGQGGKNIVNTPKTDASVRIVNIDERTVELLKRWRITQHKILMVNDHNSLNTEQLLFSNVYTNKMLTGTAPFHWKDDVIKNYDLKEVTVHSFRRTYATLAIESGSTLKEVQVQLGHSDYKTTANIYTEVTKKQKKEISNKFANYVNF